MLATLVTLAVLSFAASREIPERKDCGVRMGGEGCSNAASCYTDMECPKGTVCCFNGCKNTCLKPVSPPVFDWTEETPHKVRPLRGPGEGTELEHTMRGETVVLPGGCFITKQQLNTLEEFSNNSHVHACFCNHGGIYCQIVD